MTDGGALHDFLPPALLESYKNAIKLICSSSGGVRVISHYDADGISAGAVICAALMRERIEFQLSITRVLDESKISELGKEDADAFIFCDMGSGQMDIVEKELGSRKVVVIDHHAPLRTSDSVHQINPHFAKIDGMSEACAATLSFLFAIGINAKNWDTAHIAFAGAIGDKQHLGGFKGLNASLLEAAVGMKIIAVSRDLLLDPLPLAEAVSESLDPYFTGLAGRPDEAASFLSKSGIDPNALVSELTHEQKTHLTSVLTLKLLSQGARGDPVMGLVAERYISTDTGTDVREISNYINACGRMGREDIAIGYCLGDPESQKEAHDIRKEYREKVRRGLVEIERDGTKILNNLQYFYSPEPTIAGSQAGLAMMFFLDQSKPVLALSRAGTVVRVSSRGTQDLVEKGLDLAATCRNAALSVSGQGGGHRIAAGATIPIEKEQEFLERMDELIGKQISKPDDG